MHFRQIFSIAFVGLCGFIGLAAYAQSAQAVETLTSRLESLLPANEQAGVAVGLVEAGEVTMTFVGNSDFSEETRFEYGSITKLFTAILLAQLVDEGVISLNESINLYLPEEVQDPKWDVVTFGQLATHSAGLPETPLNMSTLVFQGGDEARSTYDKAMLYEAVREVEPGSTGGLVRYSNFGFGLLGQLLTNVTQTSYADLIQTRLFTPLDMKGATLRGRRSDVDAAPLTSEGDVAVTWDANALASAGAARGNLNDALKFLEASMSACGESTPLAMANCRAQQATEIKGIYWEGQGLGWHLSESPNGDIVWHNGATRGFRSFLGFSAKKDTGIVLLANVRRMDVTGAGLEFLASLKGHTP